VSDRAQQRGKERGGDFRNQEAQGIGSPADQPFGGGTGAILQLGDGAPDLGCRILGHRAGLVDDPADGRNVIDE